MNSRTDDRLAAEQSYYIRSVAWLMMPVVQMVMRFKSRNTRLPLKACFFVGRGTVHGSVEKHPD